MSIAAPIEIEWRQLSADAGGSKGAVQLQSGEILATRSFWSDGKVRVVCSRSTDGGKTWSSLATIAQETGKADLGDGHLLQLPSGTLLYSYRHHRFATQDNEPNHYSIRIAVSHDKGASWSPHSTVATSSHNAVQNPSSKRGLWSSFLLLKKDGTLVCVYDDEDTPHREGFPRHQWLTMKTWNSELLAWKEPITVSRAHDESHLSRDGMPTMIELSEGRFICVFESVKTDRPHANCIRYVTSDDGGQTWSWIGEKRGFVFEANDHLAISPWMARLSTNELICIFATDEDRDTPGVSGTSPGHLFTDLKATVSYDDGQTWSPLAQPVFNQTHRSYMPGILLLQENDLLVTFFDFAKRKPRALRGTISRR